jgi:hypothetical protein
MTSGAELPSKKPVKICLTGDSGVGKSGAQVSLILAGYKIRTIDVDNGLDIVLNCLHDKKSPYYALAQKLNLSDAFRYETVNHKMITMDTGADRVRIQPAAGTVWPQVERLVHTWKETDGTNLGSITSWSDDTVLCLDSSTFAAYAALAYVQQLNSHLGKDINARERQRDIGGAQEKVENLLRLLYSDAVKCHVLIMTHINYFSESTQRDTTTQAQIRVVSSSGSEIFGSDRAYPSSIGRALDPRFGRYFNNVLEMRVEGTGRATRYVIHTTPQGAIRVKTSAPFSLKPTYDVSTGLAEIFAVLRGQPEPSELISAVAKAKDQTRASATPIRPVANPVL